MKPTPKAIENAAPEDIAADIVNRFSWSSNVLWNGQLVGEQYVVALAIADAIRAERAALAGMVPMPREPTPAIIKAYIAADRRRKRYAATAKRDYRAMIAAAEDER